MNKLKKINLIIITTCIISLLFLNPFIMFATPIVIYRGKPKPNSWARWMVARTMKKNNSNLISFVGKTGSGKTWSAISICEIMSKMDGVPFGIDNIVFDLTELFNLINSGKLQRGSKIVCDEFQCSIGAREYQSQANKIFNYHLSTGRHKNYSIFFCTPFEKLLDINTRKLFHGRFETLGINLNKQTCRLKPRFLEYSDWKSEPYRKQLIVTYKDNESSDGYKSKKLFFWDVPKPSQALIEQYERKKLEFTTRLNKNIAIRLNKYNDDGKSITGEQKELIVQERKPLTPTQLKVIKVLANNKYEVASKILGISMSAIHKNKVLAEKKGYKLEEFKENV